MENNDLIFNENKIEPFTLIHDVLSNLWVVLLGALGAAMLASVIMQMRYAPTYSTSATFVVAQKSSIANVVDMGTSADMAKTLQKVLQSSAMKKIISNELGEESLNAQITASTVGDTNLLVLRVTAKSSREAMDVIRVVMDNYMQVSYYAMGNVMMDVLEEPAVPIYPDNPLNVKGLAKKVFLITAAGLILLFGLASYLKDTIKREEDIEKKLDARSLGAIPFERKSKTFKEMVKNRKKALLVNSPTAGFRFVEGYKKFATKVEYQMKKKDVKAVVVTSVSENEGKSTVATNLAITLAEQNKKVVLIEGDLRRPAQFLIFNTKPDENQEIGEFLKGNTGVKEVIVKSKIPSLYLVLGRNCYSSSTEMVQSAKLKELLEHCEKKVDYIIIDSPPIGLIGDAEVIAAAAGSVLVVTKQNFMLAEDINEALDCFRARNIAVLGVVLNHVKSFPEIVENGAYGTYGSYGKYTNAGRSRGNE